MGLSRRIEKAITSNDPGFALTAALWQKSTQRAALAHSAMLGNQANQCTGI